jgi:hypothetical protein
MPGDDTLRCQEGQLLGWCGVTFSRLRRKSISFHDYVANHILSQIWDMLG